MDKIEISSKGQSVFLKTKEVAAMLNVCPKTFNKHYVGKGIAAYYVGCYPRFKVDEVMEFIEGLKSKSN